jgi:hypothetical protein
MSCPQVIKPRQEYYVACGKWGESVFSSRDLIAEADQVRSTAFEARNEAAGRLDAHQISCATCRREQFKLIRGRFDSKGLD